ncbi:protein translocase subunit SecDF [Lutimonas zeaxanthinifaciens]|uniref:protein translocase subunit SecDF n=1 Tax=Lutimonas zeaxanthinifaciens TaxID=3060215 RepID=UPI00265C9E0C|nr:protein translocase subunit SecDF [Lutimonas sp. YSD2104]WKK66382.1 protein translocase subunit SecDF [Lutimonas sp. YSD2104]
MQNKGLIRLFAVILSVVCLYQLSFTWLAKNVEKDAVIYAESKAESTDPEGLGKMEREYLDSVANTPVVNLGFAEFTYNEVKEKEINLGLDLKGGINAILEVSVKDILFGLSNESKNPVFNEALNNAAQAQKNSDKDYLQLFYEEFDKASQGSVKLSDPSIFGNKSLKDKINFKMSDDEVKPILQEEVKGSINTAFEVLRSRIDRFGVTQPNIQRIGESGRILIELPGAKDIDRVRKLLQSTAELQFWEVFTNQELSQFFLSANTKLAEILKVEDEVEDAQDTTQSEEDEIDDLLGEVKDSVNFETANPLFSKLFPRFPQSQNDISSIIATASVKDTAEINQYLAMKEIRALLPAEQKYAKFAWDAKANNDFISLYALKSNRNDEAPIQGDVISDASQVFDQLGANPEVSMTMNSKGTKQWAKMTTANVGKFVAVVLDDYVYSAPRVNDAITTGRTSIMGQFTIDEAQDLANALKSGKLPAAARIIQSDVVGPSLGQEAIDSGTYSFIIALIIVLIWMIFYYGKAGIFSDIALALNILFIFGVLTSFGAVLTLPGIAGIVLTIGMSVDANVLIYERIKEELNKGKGLKESINDGFGGALSSILDANITTLLTGIILYVFGTGPVKGFATTLMIGIVTSLFSAIFITRLLIEWYVNKDRKLTFNTNITKNWFKDIDVDFLKKRKMSFIISGIILVIGLGSLFTNGLNYGVDFKGGRTYTVRFEDNVSPPEIANSLKDAFESSPEVKTFGSANQLKITTKYKIDDYGVEVEDEIQQLLYNGLGSYFPESLSYEQFKPGDKEVNLGIMEFYMVGPTIADDIKQAAFWAIIGSLIVVFIYILIRFRKWQFSLGAVAAVFHDVLIVLSIFSLFYKILPFDMEIGQSFIAAILTVVGYSLNDTVVIFDRIREFDNKHPMWKYSRTVNTALSSTLGRTVNTSLTTLIVLLAIFIFGGDSIKGFMFALIIGVIVGTYSSLFIASPIMYDTTEKLNKKKKS